jgi:hypothetical protein
MNFKVYKRRRISCLVKWLSNFLTATLFPGVKNGSRIVDIDCIILKLFFKFYINSIFWTNKIGHYATEIIKQKKHEMNKVSKCTACWIMKPSKEHEINSWKGKGLLMNSTFWNITPFSLLKVNRLSAATFSFETSVSFQRTTWRYIPEDTTLLNHCCENLRS